jgi:hypothetical protein
VCEGIDIEVILLFVLVLLLVSEEIFIGVIELGASDLRGVGEGDGFRESKGLSELVDSGDGEDGGTGFEDMEVGASGGEEVGVSVSGGLISGGVGVTAGEVGDLGVRGSPSEFFVSDGNTDVW